MKNIINIKIQKYINFLISLVLLVIVISGCTDATFNPNSPIDEVKKEQEEKHKSTLDLLTKYTWQMSFKDIAVNEFPTIMTFKFNTDGVFITEIFGSKQILTWRLSEDSKYIITYEQDIHATTNTLDSLEILQIDDNNLHLEVLNDNDPGKSILALVPFSPQFAQFELQSLIINQTQSISLENARLIVVWQINYGGTTKEIIWGNTKIDSNYTNYTIAFNSQPPLECLNIIDSKKMLGFAHVILTNQKDLPTEGDVTGKINHDLIIGGLNNKAIIYKIGDYIDETRPWIGYFGQTYNIGEASSDENVIWMNYFPSFPILTVDYSYNLKFPRF